MKMVPSEDPAEDRAKNAPRVDLLNLRLLRLATDGKNMPCAPPMTTRVTKRLLRIHCFEPEKTWMTIGWRKVIADHTRLLQTRTTSAPILSLSRPPIT
jgi:hypothetical protein